MIHFDDSAWCDVTSSCWTVDRSGDFREQPPRAISRIGKKRRQSDCSRSAPLRTDQHQRRPFLTQVVAACFALRVREALIPASGSSNCLPLNVWPPALAAASKIRGLLSSYCRRRRRRAAFVRSQSTAVHGVPRRGSLLFDAGISPRFAAFAL